MTEVVVTRKGQATIPIGLRRKYKIMEGSRLEAIDTGEGIFFKPKLSFFDLDGSGAGRAGPKDMKIPLDKLREENA